jgi:succinate dehydrogenase hydrophobic anchor subunit
MSVPKIVVVLLLLAIVVALFSGMYFLLKDGSDKRRTVKALTWRVGLQVGLILFLVVAYFLGWIQPHNVGQ